VFTKPLPFCLSPSKFGSADGLRSTFVLVAEATGSRGFDYRRLLFCAILAISHSVVFKASSTWSFFAC
jgi:hypothetical protein